MKAYNSILPAIRSAYGNPGSSGTVRASTGYIIGSRPRVDGVFFDALFPEPWAVVTETVPGTTADNCHDLCRRIGGYEDTAVTANRYRSGGTRDMFH